MRHLIAEIYTALLMSAEVYALRLDDLLIDAERHLCEKIASEVIRGFNARDDAVRLCARATIDIHIVIRDLWRLEHIYLCRSACCRHLVPARALRRIDGLHLAGLVRVQQHDLAVRAAAEQIQLVVTAIIVHRHHGLCHARAIVLGDGTYLDMTVIIHAAQHSTREVHMRLIMCHHDRIYKLILSALRVESIELVADLVICHVKHAIVAAPRRRHLWELSQQPLAAISRRILSLRILRTALTCVHRARADLWIDRYGLDIVMQMAAADEIDMHLLRYGSYIAVIEIIRVRMVQHDDAPFCIFRRWAG